MTKHPDIRKISFTGSTATGQKVMASAAQTLKRITLELGGNDAGIVLDDVDPKKVAPGIFEGAFQNSGQVCLAIKRLYVHEFVYDEICNELVAIAKNTVVDDGSKQGTKLGPLQNKMQYEKVKAFLDDARKNGNVIAGGSAMDRPGYFIEPTIVRDIKEGSKLVDEEQFGPVLPVIKYSDKDDVIRRANATTYGLGASVWSSDVKRAHEIASQIEAGTVWINKHLDMAPNIPFGGAKQSGIGTEFAEEGLAEFTQLQIINGPRRGLIPRTRGRGATPPRPPLPTQQEAHHVRRPMRPCSLGLCTTHQDPDAVLRDFAAELNARGLRVVGMVQAGQCADCQPVGSAGPQRRKDIAGAGFRPLRERLPARPRQGFRTRAPVIADALEAGADLLIVNRFGKRERDGKGLAYLIERALGADIPVVIAVSSEQFRGLDQVRRRDERKLHCDRAALQAWWNGVSAGDARRGARFPATVCEIAK